ncbi:glycoside hydrolase family 125 protein [Cohnella hongkongensis]|uniref:Glycoside hydrolase family 125 protein n=1 Tax=Cohnella hongkongensis TaxID=178337 RepID=A0ABV9FAJ5_9BACL
MYSSIHRTAEAAAGRLNRINPELARVFRQSYLNTLDTTVERLADGTTFVITGDIPAMWLRDSSAQVRPYVKLASKDEQLAAMIRGLILRQAQYLLLDPYANAFNKEANGNGHQQDRTEMGPTIWERKFELDSLCYPVQLLYDYWSATGDRSIFNEVVRMMMTTIVDTMIVEQHHDSQSPYSFERDDILLPSDTLPFDGRGTRTNFTGMVWSGFRPSDDACKFGYLIPANMFAVVILGHIESFAQQFYDDAPLAEKAKKLRNDITFGIETYGVYNHPVHGPIYAYETDGYGNYNLMDDANVPSLLSIPYLGFLPADDPMYQRTRAFVLSPDNPYYYDGAFAKGIGSPHTPPGYIWPIALIMQGLTATAREEREALIEQLLATTAGTGFMHESFDPDQFTREWFAWANSLFGQFVLEWLEEKDATVPV